MSNGKSWRCCVKCGETKPESEFYADGVQKGRHRPKRRLKCRQCTRAQMRKRYEDRRREIDEYKSARGCADCGWNKHPRALDFDHLPGSGKEYIVSQLVTGNYPMTKVWAEIAKCEVVCSNCHRIRTAERESGNTAWDLRFSSKTADEIGQADTRPPFEQLTLEV
ncbi:hypothetical protein [Gordonia sp. ABSL49_1]|uniref:hypothetical protein n=1 Tax=Gordonia sp. ABSL49_1 TaxID=2920941 RepID=UPI001F0DE141|nr:hypothetical protein [Gordonia sp. ABSL49_1]MCH5645183.1 hypothetical protein [Gordonia sp. ABSL49_1]